MKRFIFLIVIVLSSCHKKADFNSTDNHIDWSQVAKWSVKGKLGINDGNTGGSGSIKWQSSHDLNEAEFKAGIHSWKIQENKDGAQLHSSKNGTKFANKAEQLITAELDMEFPWDQLKNWLRGLDSDINTTQQQRPISTLNQDGWRIEFQKWTNTSVGLLPKKIKAVKPPYTVKLVIHQWQINQ